MDIFRSSPALNLFRQLSRIQIKEVTTTAEIVPKGIDFCGSDKSPDLLEPDMKPVET